VPAREIVAALIDGAAHRFAETIAAEVPTSGAGIYTVWDEDGKLVYVGLLDATRTARGSRAGCAATPTADAAAISSASMSPITMCFPT